MKNSFFVSSERELRLVFEKDGKSFGDRFTLRVVFERENLDKNGFVVDFMKVADILDKLEREIEGVPLNSVLGGDSFNFRNFLVFIKNFVEKGLNDSHILISEVSLKNHTEGYIAKF